MKDITTNWIYKCLFLSMQKGQQCNDITYLLNYLLNNWSWYIYLKFFRVALINYYIFYLKAILKIIKYSKVYMQSLIYI